MMRRRRLEGSRVDRFLGRNFGKLLFGGIGAAIGIPMGMPGGLGVIVLLSTVLGIMFGFMGALTDAAAF